MADLATTPTSAGASAANGLIRPEVGGSGDGLTRRRALALVEHGGEVAARIESDPTLHRTAVVFLTALVTKTEAGSALRIQGRPFLAKSTSIPELVAGIERNLPARAAFRL